MILISLRFYFLVISGLQFVLFRRRSVVSKNILPRHIRIKLDSQLEWTEYL
jgi:hypothetical protein